MIYQRSSTHPFRCQVYARRSHEARIDGRFLNVGHDFVAGTSEARGHSKGERGEGESINTMGDSRWIAGAEALAGGRPAVLASNYTHACVQRDLFQDPKKFVKFVNVNKFFSKDVITAGPWVTLSSVEQDEDSPDWLLTLLHGKMSTMIVSALPELKMEK